MCVEGRDKLGMVDDLKFLSFSVKARDPVLSVMGTDLAGPTDPNGF